MGGPVTTIQLGDTGAHKLKRAAQDHPQTSQPNSCTGGLDQRHKTRRQEMANLNQALEGLVG